ncbi:MAG TPA: NPCBM/NEW2 domain-containing protein, partial [Bacteroidota bacterium]|nr:NPCBM/NEW2 domain-containing protein [Bacteroidota bacterium]
WKVSFDTAYYYHFPSASPGDLSIERVGIDGANIHWDDQYYLAGGFRVYLDSTLLGYTSVSKFPLRHLDPLASHTVSVKTVWMDGIESKKSGNVKFTLKSMLPNDLYLSELEPARATIGWGMIGSNRSVSENPISINGKKYAYGVGTHANSDIEYDLHGMYDSFSATVGIDDGNNFKGGSVEFIVMADGKTLWTSGVINKGDAAKSISLNIAGANHLLLRALAASKSIDYDHADWADAKITRK